jgi:hypothetical protein
MTITMLLYNTVESAKNRLGIAEVPQIPKEFEEYRK